MPNPPFIPARNPALAALAACWLVLPHASGAGADDHVSCESLHRNVETVRDLLDHEEEAVRDMARVGLEQELEKLARHPHCSDWREASESEDPECILVGDNGNRTYALAGIPLPLDAEGDGHTVLFVGAEAVSRAEAIARELNALEREGPLPSEWVLACR